MIRRGSFTRGSDRCDEGENALVELLRDDVVRREDDLRSALEGGLGHDVDRGRLELDEVHVRVDALELLPQRVPPREVAGDVDDLGVEVVGRRGAGREDGGAAAAQRLGRAQPELGRDDRDVGDRADRLAVRPAGVDDEVGDEHAIRVETGARVVTAVRDEDPRVHLDRRERRAAAVEHEQLGLELRGELRALEDVRQERSAREPSPGPPAADRRDARERGRLEMVGRRMPAGAGEREQVVERRRRLDELRLRRPASAHRDDDDAAVGGEDTRDVARHRGLPDPLPEADHGERRRPDRLERRRVEAEVGADVRQPERERPRRPEHPLPRPEHRLVGEVDHEVHLDRVERVDERDAVVVVTRRELLRPADEQRADDVVRKRLERIAHDRRVVLAVDEGQSAFAHVERTSSSIRAVYFSYVFVSVENWMIRSCSWNG